MQHIFKWFFIIVLLLSSIAAAFFMILESGSFYQTLYASNSNFYGYWAAALNELFMAIMAAVWITEKNKHGVNRPHLINYFFKLLLVVLFVTTIAGASYYVASPVLNNINSQENQTRILNIIDSQIENDRKSVEIFSAQNQKTNTALAAKRTWENHQQAKVLIGKSKQTFSLWFQLIIIIMLRVGIQSSNLGCVWLASWLYRRSPARMATQDQKSILPHESKTIITTKPKTPLDTINIVHPSSVKTLDAKSESKNLKLSTQSIKGKINKKPKILPTTEKKNRSIPLKNSDSIIDDSKQDLLLKSPNKGYIATTSKALANPGKKTKTNNVKKTFSTNIIDNQLYPRKNEVLNLQDNIPKIRKQIIQYLNLRNEGVLLRDLAKVIGQTEKSMMDIKNTKIPNHHFELKNLEKILNRCKSIFDHESASSF